MKSRTLKVPVLLIQSVRGSTRLWFVCREWAITKKRFAVHPVRRTWFGNLDVIANAPKNHVVHQDIVLTISFHKIAGSLIFAPPPSNLSCWKSFDSHSQRRRAFTLNNNAFFWRNYNRIQQRRARIQATATIHGFTQLKTTNWKRCCHFTKSGNLTQENCQIVKSLSGSTESPKRSKDGFHKCCSLSLLLWILWFYFEPRHFQFCWNMWCFSRTGFAVAWPLQFHEKTAIIG